MNLTCVMCTWFRLCQCIWRYIRITLEYCVTLLPSSKPMSNLPPKQRHNIYVREVWIHVHLWKAIEKRQYENYGTWNLAEILQCLENGAYNTFGTGIEFQEFSPCINNVWSMIMRLDGITHHDNMKHLQEQQIVSTSSTTLTLTRRAQQRFDMRSQTRAKI